MLDKILMRGNAEKDSFTDTYTPDQVIISRKLVNPSGKTLSVIFPPWHGGGKYYEKLISRLAHKGNAVLAYYFHDEILKPDVEQVRASYQYLKNAIADELEQLKKKHYTRIRLIGLSLGTPALAIVASTFRDFDEAILVPTASSLAKSTWHGSRTQHIRQHLEMQGCTLAALESAWSELAPVNHIDALRGKDVRIVVSRHYTLIPTRYQVEFIDAMRAAGLKPKVQKSKLGHYATVGRFCLYGKIR